MSSSSCPAPPILPLPSSALGSRACRGTLPPQARRLTHLPGPGTCSPRNAREFSEGFISQGLKEPQNPLDSAPGKERKKRQGFGTPPCFPSLSHSHTDPMWPPTSSIHHPCEEGKGFKARGKPTGDTCFLGRCCVSPPWSQGKPFFSPHAESHLPSTKAAQHHFWWVLHPSKPGSPS